MLVDEVEHKWRVPRLLYLTIITCSIGAAVQGWDQEGSNGANLSFPVAFGIGGSSDYDTYLVGLINSAPYLSSWYVSPILAARRGATPSLLPDLIPAAKLVIVCLLMPIEVSSAAGSRTP